MVSYLYLGMRRDSNNYFDLLGVRSERILFVLFVWESCTKRTHVYLLVRLAGAISKGAFHYAKLTSQRSVGIPE